MRRHGTDLTLRKLRSAASVAGGRSVKEIAACHGVSESVIYGHLVIPLGLIWDEARRRGVDIENLRGVRALRDNKDWLIPVLEREIDRRIRIDG